MISAEQRVLVVLGLARPFFTASSISLSECALPFSALPVAVEQHDRDAGLGGDIGDARAHEAGADDADLPDFVVCDPGRPARALVELLQRHEQRADHRRRLLVCRILVK